MTSVMGGQEGYTSAEPGVKGRQSPEKLFFSILHFPGVGPGRSDVLVAGQMQQAVNDQKDQLLLQG